MNPEQLQLFIPIAGLLAVGFAIFLARDVLSRDTGTKEMMEVSATINEGAVAFIKRQYLTIGILAVVGAFIIGGVISLLETKNVADTGTFGLDLGIRTGVAFGVGAACSMACGIIGMLVSVKA
ncbi:MAG TPA: sodium/proton-translocating pyrophosphatase, partial [Candidatus Limnocylindrales bacterium]